MNKDKPHPLEVPQDLQLEGPRLLLKPISLDDAENIHQLLSDPEVMKHLKSLSKLPQGWSLEESKERIQCQMDLQKVNLKLNFHVYLKSNSIQTQNPGHGQELDFVGSCGFPRLELSNHSAAVGIIIGKKYWSSMYGTECLFLLLKYAFESLHLHRLTIETSENNLPMRGWLEKVALANLESTMKEALYEDGGYTSLSVYTLFDNDWYNETKQHILSKLKRILSDKELESL